MTSQEVIVFFAHYVVTMLRLRRQHGILLMPPAAAGIERDRSDESDRSEMPGGCFAAPQLKVSGGGRGEAAKVGVDKVNGQTHDGVEAAVDGAYAGKSDPFLNAIGPCFVKWTVSRHIFTQFIGR